MGGEIFLTRRDRPWGSPSLLYNGYRVFPGVNSGRGVTLIPHPLLVPWSRKSKAIPLLPLCTVRPVQHLSACTRVHFTLHLTIAILPKANSYLDFCMLAVVSLFSAAQPQSQYFPIQIRFNWFCYSGDNEYLIQMA